MSERAGRSEQGSRARGIAGVVGAYGFDHQTHQSRRRQRGRSPGRRARRGAGSSWPVVFFVCACVGFGGSIVSATFRRRLRGSATGARARAARRNNSAPAPVRRGRCGAGHPAGQAREALASTVGRARGAEAGRGGGARGQQEKRGRGRAVSSGWLAEASLPLSSSAPARAVLSSARGRHRVKSAGWPPSKVAARAGRGGGRRWRGGGVRGAPAEASSAPSSDDDPYLGRLHLRPARVDALVELLGAGADDAGRDGHGCVLFRRGATERSVAFGVCERGCIRRGAQE